MTQTTTYHYPDQIDVTALFASGFTSKNTDGQTYCCRHRVGRGEAESTPAETALPTDTDDIHELSAKRVVETGSLGV